MFDAADYWQILKIHHRRMRSYLCSVYISPAKTALIRGKVNEAAVYDLPGEGLQHDQVGTSPAPFTGFLINRTEVKLSVLHSSDRIFPE